MIKGTLVPSGINEGFSQQAHPEPAVGPAILLCLAHCEPKGVQTWIPSKIISNNSMKSRRIPGLVEALRSHSPNLESQRTLTCSS